MVKMPVRQSRARVGVQPAPGLSLRLSPSLLLLSLLLLLLLLACCAPAVSGGAIFIDYTNGVQFPLVSGASYSTDYDARILTGGGPGSISFGLLWNGDIQGDAFYSINHDTDALLVTAVNAPNSCHASNSYTQLSSVQQVCNYTAAWTQPFDGQLELVYDNGAWTQPQLTTTIFIPFSSQAPPVFIDYTSGLQFPLAPSLISPGDLDTEYLTGGGPGSMSFGVLWNGDVSGNFDIANWDASALVVTALNDPERCNADNVNQLDVSARVCNYTVSWSRPYQGVLTITYTVVNTQPKRDAMISIPFSSAAPPVFIDYTSGRQFSIVYGATSTVDTDSVYLTAGGSGSMSFGLLWNGDDSSDTFIITNDGYDTVVSPLTIRSLNNPESCTYSTSSAGLVDVDTRVCNWTVAWSQPWTGVLAITYFSVNSQLQPMSQMTINIPFSSAAPPVFIDYTSRVFFASSATNAADTDTEYLTGGGPGSMSFGMLWNGDAGVSFYIENDEYGSPLSVTALNNPESCTPQFYWPLTLDANTPVCNYTVQWSAPYDGVLPVQYYTYNAQLQSTTTITIPFSTAVPVVSSSSGVSAARFLSSSSSSHKARHSAHHSLSSSAKKKK